ncbi:MAG: hypothetical protein IPM91_17470 [Bacteroidetes bacterium]|nr:hypothetical protein [Bacteroidota bacterium]
MLKNKLKKHFLFFKVLFLYTIITAGNASGQYVITTLRCDSTITNCDTISTEFYNAQKKLEKKWKNGNPSSSVEYLYSEQGVLYRKIHRNHLGRFKKATGSMLIAVGAGILTALSTRTVLYYLFFDVHLLSKKINFRSNGFIKMIPKPAHDN